MPRILWLADVLTDAGLTVRSYSGWETRGKDDFTPRGVMLHHTVTRPTTADSTVDRMLAVTGSADVPPPLANYSTNRDGSVSVIAAGTANHAGKGEWQGFTGSRYFLGDEMKNLGSGDSRSAYYESWVPRQLESARIAAAAVMNHIGADPIMFTFHKEYGTRPPGWPGRKTDPHTLVIADERELVRQLMEGIDMPLTPEDLRAIWLHLIDDQVTGQNLHAQTFLKATRTDAYRARVDAAIARAVVEKIATDEPSVNLDPATIADLAAQVAAAVDEELAAAVATELAERLAD